MPARVEPVPGQAGTFRVVAGQTVQSWVDPADPEHLEFEYVQRLCEALEATVLRRPLTERVRVVHLGGGGLTIPRWVAARRPRTAQLVCEPDEDLMADVRRVMPLPRQSGIKVRAVDGRAGLAAMPAGYADAVVLDAFDGPRVPVDLTTTEFFDEVARVARPGALFAANVTDRAPFGWVRRFAAGARAVFPEVTVSAEAAVWKGRRFGNLVVVASAAPLPAADLAARAARAVFPYRMLHGREVRGWLGGTEPLADADAVAAPVPRTGTWFS